MQLERKLLIFTTAALAGLGLLMVYSSSITAKPSFADQKILTRQLIFLCAGIVAAAAVARLPIEFWRRTAVPLFAGSVVLLVAVLIPGVGSRINGAQRWFRVASFGFQPSELAKVALVLLMARWLESKGESIRHFWNGWLPVMVPAAVVGGLVLIEPDFGTAVFLLAIALMMIFLAGVPIWHMLVSVASAVPVVGFLVLTQPYRVQRIFQFMQAWTDPNAAPYQVQQSLVAFGSGGLWGTGLGQGWQKLGFLPEANSDFVLAVVGEELGLAGTVMVLALWSSFLVCGVRLARKSGPDLFPYLAAFGLIAQSVLQAAINVAVVTGTLPPKGISLPFISAGGSNLVISLVSVGIVLGMSREGNRAVKIDGRKPISSILVRSVNNL